MTTKEISQLFEKSNSIQLPSHEEILIYVSSTVNASNFGDSSDKAVSFSYVIFYRKEEYVSTEYLDLNECIFDAFEEAWQVQHIPPSTGWDFNN